MTANGTKIPWPRILVEGTVIVERLQRVIRVHEWAERLVTELQGMSAAQLAAVPADSAGLYVAAMSVPLDFDSQDGTLDAMMASSRLEVITDHRLRELLAGWKSIVADADEEVAMIRARSGEIELLQAQLGGPWRRALPGGPGLALTTGRCPDADLQLVANGASLMALSRTKVFSAGVYLSEPRIILAHAESVLELVKANRQ